MRAIRLAREALQAPIRAYLEALDDESVGLGVGGVLCVVVDEIVMADPTLRSGSTVAALATREAFAEHLALAMEEAVNG